MGFRVINDSNDENAIVSSIQNKDNEKLGLKIGSRILELNRVSVEGDKYDDIVKKILKLKKNPPFKILFRAVMCFVFRIFNLLYLMYNVFTIHIINI